MHTHLFAFAMGILVGMGLLASLLCLRSGNSRVDLPQLKQKSLLLEREIEAFWESGYSDLAVWNEIEWLALEIKTLAYCVKRGGNY